MKKTLTLLVALLLWGVALPSAEGQQEAAVDDCKSYFQSPFVITGRPFRSILTGDEVAEFHATLFSGTTYRIAVGGGEKSHLIFAMYDTDHNLLFNSQEHGNAPYWDFAVDGYLEAVVETRLDPEMSQSGFAVVMTGIKINDEEE